MEWSGGGLRRVSVEEGEGRVRMLISPGTDREEWKDFYQADVSPFPARQYLTENGSP